MDYTEALSPSDLDDVILDLVLMRCWTLSWHVLFATVCSVPYI